MLIPFKDIKPFKLFSDLETGALFNFFILAFFTFMGTSLPFQERLIDSYEAETTNIINQIVFIFLFFSSSILIIQNPKKTLSFIRNEKYLTLFISFCLISFLWSNYSLISFKRSFQLFVTYITILNAVLYVRTEYIISSFKIVCFIYIGVTFYSGLFIPQAIDPEFGTWRGIELQKNLLGHTSLMIFTLALYFLTYSQNILSKISDYLLIIFSILAIILSGSSTNMIAVMVVFLILIMFNIDKYFTPLGSRRLFSTLIIVTIIFPVLVVSVFAPDILSFIPGFFGKDLTFTGRSSIWTYIWAEILKKFWLGYGYGSYWIMGTSVIDKFQFAVGWRVNEAHNGFLEIMLQTGVVGFTLFLSLLISFVYKVIKSRFNIALLALISIVIVNFSESFVFAERSPSTLVFIFFYLLSSMVYSKNGSSEA